MLIIPVYVYIPVLFTLSSKRTSTKRNLGRKGIGSGTQTRISALKPSIGNPPPQEKVFHLTMVLVRRRRQVTGFSSKNMLWSANQNTLKKTTTRFLGL